MLVIANPKAGLASAKRLRRALEELRLLGYAPTVETTDAIGDARTIAAAAAADGVDMVVAAGGDGTIADVVAGLMEGGKAGAYPGRPALGVLPLGTANVLAREIGVPLCPEAAARVLRFGRRRPLRPGLLDGRPFVVGVGAGLDSAVVEHYDPVLKGRVGRLAYVWQAWKTVTAGKESFPLVRARLTRPDGGEETLEGLQILVLRGPFYGGAISVVPNADIADDRIWVLALKPGGTLRASIAGLVLPTGLLRFLPGVKLRRAVRVEIEGVDLVPTVQADGDGAGRLPATVTVAPETVDLIAPAA